MITMSPVFIHCGIYYHIKSVITQRTLADIVRRPTFGEQGGEVEVDAGGEVEEEERGIVLQSL